MNQNSADKAYGWFDPLYKNANRDISKVPWSLPGALPMLSNWLTKAEGSEKSAVVVGCGLGDDAEAIAQAGYTVTAFDVSPQAIDWAKQRFPSSPVNYVAADLFNLPAAWIHQFDLVFDFRTIQALPLSVRTTSIENIAALGKPGGTVLIATYLRPANQDPDENPPWPLSEEELAHFEAVGLTKAGQEKYAQKKSRFSDRILAEYRVP